jgi:N utilization substance protein B
MQPRRIARELALLGVSQLPATPAKLDQKRLEDLLLAAIRTLAEETQDVLSQAADEVRRSHRLLHESEQILPTPQVSEIPPAGKETSVDTKQASSSPRHPSRREERAESRSESQRETESLLLRIQQVQHQIHQVESALRSAQAYQELRQELIGLATQANASLTSATQFLTQLEQRLFSARQIMDDAIALSQGAINRVGAAIALPEFLQLAHSAEVRAYALELLTQFQTHKLQVDQILQAALVGWQLGRLGRIERDILRLAVVEMNVLASVPTRVAINEAVELAKKYGNEESPTFINGVLRRVSEGVSPAKQEDSPDPEE